MLIYKHKGELNMAGILKHIHQLDKRLEQYMGRFAARHPGMFFFMTFIGMPALILLVVAALTVIITLPVAWIFGWL